MVDILFIIFVSIFLYFKVGVWVLKIMGCFDSDFKTEEGLRVVCVLTWPLFLVIITSVFFIDVILYLNGSNDRIEFFKTLDNL